MNLIGENELGFQVLAIRFFLDRPFVMFKFTFALTVGCYLFIISGCCNLKVKTTIVFFSGDPYHAYYQYKVNEIRDGKAPKAPAPPTPKQGDLLTYSDFLRPHKLPTRSYLRF